MKEIKEIKIKKIVPAKVWYYMYAYTDGGDYFIYAHRDKVSYFAQKESENISYFDDALNKLVCIKYFEGKNIGMNKKSILEHDGKVKVGTCLISEEIEKHFKAEVWVNSDDEEITFKLFDSGKYQGLLDSDIDLWSQ